MLTYSYSSYQESHGCDVPRKSRNQYNYDGFGRCGFSFKLAQKSEMPPTPTTERRCRAAPWCLSSA